MRYNLRRFRRKNKRRVAQKRLTMLGLRKPSSFHGPEKNDLLLSCSRRSVIWLFTFNRRGYSGADYIMPGVPGNRDKLDQAHEQLQLL